MKKKFLTVYDYGMGGVWRYIRADSAKDVLDKYPKLEVLHREPDWFTDESRRLTETNDINDPPDIFLRRMRGPLPAVHMELPIGADDAAELKRLITGFAETQGFVVENIEHLPIHGRSGTVFDMLLLRPDIDMRVNDFAEPNRLRIDICDAARSPEFEAVAAKFEALLRDRWPDKLRLVAED